VKPPVPRVHAVTDRDVAALPNLSSVTATLAHSPHMAFHARYPGVDGARLLDLANALRAAAAPKSPLIVNDRIDVAWVVRAAGVHLPENGLPLSAARALLSPDQLLGRSVHHPDDARRAADEGADYVFLGPIWQTASHPDRTRHRRAAGAGAVSGDRDRRRHAGESARVP
jgi:thiamine-phosphate diphosphorylase